MMTRENKLLFTTIIYTISNFFSKVSIFILLMIYTRSLSIPDYGYYDLVLSTVTIISPIISLQIADAAFRFLLIKDANSESNLQAEETYISSATAIVTAGLIMFSFIYIFFAKYFISRDLLLVYLTIFSWTIFTFLQQIARGRGQSVAYSISGAIYSLALVALSPLLLLFPEMRLEAVFFSYIFAATSGLIYLLIKTKYIALLQLDKISKEAITSMVKYCFPLLLSAICWWIVISANRYFILLFLGVESNGIFGVASNFSSILYFTNGIFTLAWQETAIREYEKNNSSVFYSQMFDGYVRIQFCIILVLIAISRIMLKLVVGPSFYIAWIQLPFLYIGAGFSGFAAFFGALYLGAGKTMARLTSVISAAVVTIIVNLLLLKRVGLLASSIAIMLSFIILWVVSAATLKKYVRVIIPKKQLFLLSGLTIIFLLLYYLHNIYVDIPMFLLSITLLILLNKNMIKRLMSMAVQYVSVLRLKKE